MPSPASLALCGGLLLAGCQPRPSSAPVDVVDVGEALAPKTSLPAPPERAGVVAAPSWVGAWTSASCSNRTYPRQIVVEADGSFFARDLVAPCPRGVQCIWSGVVERRGAWRSTPEGLLLQPDASSDKGAPFPASLVWDEVLRAPVEQVPGARCAYSRP